MKTTGTWIVSFGLLSLAAVAGMAVVGMVAPGGDVTVITDTGDHRTITGEQAEAYHATNAWLEARLKEVESIRAGSTYGDVARYFKRDGGIAEPTRHRFVSILCPFLKIDVEFEDKEGVKARHPLAATAKVVSVSKPYFEREFGD